MSNPVDIEALKLTWNFIAGTIGDVPAVFVEAVRSDGTVEDVLALGAEDAKKFAAMLAKAAAEVERQAEQTAADMDAAISSAVEL